MLIVEPVAYPTVRTLSSLCLFVIKDLLISYVHSLPASNKSTLPDALFVISPFDPLPSQCVQELINLLAEKKQLDITLLSVLIHTHLTSIDLSPLIQNAKQLIKPKLFQLITSRCTELLHLTLGMSCNMMGGKLVLNTLISNNKVLRTLIVSNFRPIDEVISRISIMRYLTTLDLSNSQLSDDGVTLLTSQEPPLPDLTSLNVSNTQITSYGMQLIFSNFISLLDLNLSQLDLTVPFVNLKPHRLTSLTLLNTDILPDNLYSLLLAVLQVQHLELYPYHNSFIDRDWLWDVLAALPDITYFSTYRSSLKLANSFTKRLEYLSLPCTLSRISAPLMCTLFPSLQHLNLDDCKITDGANSPGIAWNTTELISLSLAGATFSQTDHTSSAEQEMLTFIGSFGNLEKLDISRTDIFTFILMDLLRRTSVFKLTHLTLHSCDKLNKDIIKFLTELAYTCTHQCCVDLSYCFNVKKSDLELFRDSLKQAIPPVQHGLSVKWL
ncbi:F-box/LRR-repeat protein 13 [Oopsacas minuta]|uniref:F-box/LRR-repeat protein 13 n=1 Tax=Oopsacas minuta TaxID=111878 RepID=A0AAV7K046_9METZ|nr:F-box/LRR-repeat protein 13 [Oopsacas minuta]